MALLQQVKAFDKTHLKSTETRVTRPDGTMYVEEHSSSPSGGSGNNNTGKEKNNTLETLSSTLSSKKQIVFSVPRNWFVFDLEPDVQVAEILPGLTMGSQDAAASLDLLQQSGVTHVINLASFVDNFFEGTFVYKKIDARDIPEFQISSHFEETNDFIASAIYAKGVVFVHCNAGISRSGSVVLAYVMKTQKMSFDFAFEFVRSKRPVVRPNPGFVKQLKEYEKTLDLSSSCKKEEQTSILE